MFLLTVAEKWGKKGQKTGFGLFLANKSPYKQPIFMHIKK
jgi:hypothetical protein